MAAKQDAQPDFTAVVELAGLPPSVHNTQPCVFHAAGDVHAAAARLLAD